MIEYLDWDSRFFGLKIGRAVVQELDESYLDSLLSQKHAENFDLIYLFLEKSSPGILEVLKERKVFLADKKVTYQTDIISSIRYDHNDITPYSGILNDELLGLALLSGWDSRFKKDARLTTCYNKLYTTWIEKSLTGEMADVIFVHQMNNIIDGFVTVSNKKDFGQIGLIAVDEKQQGKGIGRKLLHTVHDWCLQYSLPKCNVVTQLDNQNACRLYERNGFNVIKMEYIFHI